MNNDCHFFVSSIQPYHHLMNIS